MGKKRVLYEKTERPDNHIEEDFMAGIRVNGDVFVWRYGEIVRKMESVSTRICLLTIFFSVFYELYSGESKRAAVAMNVFVFGVYGVLFFYGVWKGSIQAAGLARCRPLVFFFVILSMFSSVIQTLTADISSNIVWLMASVCVFIHLLFWGYESRSGLGEGWLLSYSMKFIASCILASRFEKAGDVFLLMNVSFFCIFPFQVILKTGGEKRVFSLFCWAISSGLLFYLSYAFLVGYYLFMATVFFGLTGVYLFFQRYKTVVNGPWDDAVPDTLGPLEGSGRVECGDTSQ
ncbi:MAG: phosphatidylinositol N-acetylglucosaminyltransferase subunit C [Amphiamblys sp. WSBS2006]|nr:MAG: phosphatidylinositol N-acetylglucosaminyltransferase subunit C [Amphiamblys sp. WSBS2006]